MPSKPRLRAGKQSCEYPPLQAPETFNLDMILKAVQSGRGSHAGD
jgi:hypothetical protein